MTFDDDYVSHFQYRVLQDAMREATADHWLKRAEQFESAVHKPGDFAGHCSAEQIQRLNARLHEKAQACRNKAAVAKYQDDDELPTVGEYTDGGVA